MTREFIALMQDTYHNEDLARTALLGIRYPPAAIPKFYTAESFWLAVDLTLDQRVTSGRIRLLKATAKLYPGSSAEAEQLMEQLMQPTAGPAVEPEPEVGPGPHPRVLPGGDPQTSAWGTPPPSPPSGLAEQDAAAVTMECPTLTLECADLVEQFQAEVRGLLGTDVELLYVTRAQSALRIPDPGEQDEAIRQKVQDAMRALEPSCLVTYQKYPFRPYVYVRLVVHGPDTSSYQLNSVPATFTPEDIAAAIIEETREAKSSLKGGLVRAIIDHESAQTSRRLDPYATLHESGVRDGDRLRVAPEAIAGCLSPELRLEALLRAVAQIRGYAGRHRPEFAIAGYDDDELPGCVTVELTMRGLAPPPDFAGSAAGNGSGEAEALVPVLVKAHRVSIHFRAMFPLAAPEVVWDTPIFHPNVRWAAAADGIRNGTLQFHPLLLGYRPEQDLAHICRVITNVAMYRDYDLSEGPGAPNPVAALWAGTEPGQIMIKAIGGRPRGDVLREGDRTGRPPRLLWLEPLEEGQHGH
jgi:hypothetical protein